jgi:hypothetical protein
MFAASHTPGFTIQFVLRSISLSSSSGARENNETKDVAGFYCEPREIYRSSSSVLKKTGINQASQIPENNALCDEVKLVFSRKLSLLPSCLVHEEKERKR